MAKKNNETEKKPIWYRTGIWATCAAIGGVAAAALYMIWKSETESAEPSVDLFKANVQPIVPPVEEAPAEEPAAASVEEKGAVVGNVETKVFHDPNCTSVARMSDEKKVSLKDRDAAIAEGYKPCGRCNP